MLEPQRVIVLVVYLGLNLAVCPVAPSVVPGPSNVSVTCHNLKNVVYWNYSRPDLQPEFVVTIRGYNSETMLVRTRQTYLDISNYTLDITDSYYVTVNADLIDSKQNVSLDTTFSYSEDFLTDITCAVDFPELIVSVSPHILELSFMHPYYVYKAESLNTDFAFDVFYNETRSEPSFCTVEDKECSVQLDLFESLYGSCIDLKIKGETLQTEITKKVCGTGIHDKTDWTVVITIAACSVVVLGFLIVLGALIFKKLTRPDSQNAIISKLLNKVNSDRVLHTPEQPILSEVMSVGHTPLLETSNQDPVNPNTVKFEENTHFPIPFITDVTPSDEQDPEEITEEADFDSSNNSADFTGYDRQKFPMDMGQGDMVEAYGPR